MAVSEELGADLTQVDICTLQIHMKYEVIPTLVCSVCLLFGLIYCFFGYRCFKVVMFFSGFMFGSAAVLLFYHKEPKLNRQLEAETKAGIGLGVGVLSGLVTLMVSTLGLVLNGLQLGGLVSLSMLVIVGQFYSLAPVWVPLWAIMAASISTAVMSLQWQKLFSIVYTSVFGATTVMLCVDFLLGTFTLPDQVHDMFSEVTPRPLCWFHWMIAGLAPALSITCGLVQWCVTARDFSHTETAHEKQKKHLKHKCRDSRRRTYRQRRPPPLKRYAGDVLAPSYLHRLQEHQMGTGSSTSSISTITHTLMDLNFDTGSMVPLTAASPTFTV
ncbi:transmembrane protein 198-like [Nematolebias whitei]|uniref:transmembrane protein 198-like n=1 Tax=Nematolebias whitei TaxID=451745 RepID=UPI001897DE2A|nr:transmembrane protein 198-like [Nematolebias whitei]